MGQGCCNGTEPEFKPEASDVGQRLQQRRSDATKVECVEEKPTLEDYNEYCSAVLTSLSEAYDKPHADELSKEMLNNARSKDRLVVIMGQLKSSSLCCSQLVDVMKMVSLDDHKREVMIGLYSHLTDREGFEEHVVAHFSLSDTLRNRVMEKLHERLHSCSQEHRETGELPTLPSGVSGGASQPGTPSPKAGTRELPESGNADSPVLDVAEENNLAEEPPPATDNVEVGGGLFCGCCAVAVAKDAVETVEDEPEQIADDQALPIESKGEGVEEDNRELEEDQGQDGALLLPYGEGNDAEGQDNALLLPSGEGNDAEDPAAPVTAAAASSGEVAKRPRCKFGEKCFRKNDEHLKEFAHPQDLDWEGPAPPSAAEEPAEDTPDKIGTTE